VGQSYRVNCGPIRNFPRAAGAKIPEVRSIAIMQIGTREQIMKFSRLLSTVQFVIFTLLFSSATALAKKPDNPGGGGGGGGNNNQDPPVLFDVQLTEGGFDFGKKTVTRNKRGNGYSSTEELDMSRPVDGTSAAWDSIFSSCSIFDGPWPVTGVHVSDNWSISNSGGNQAGTIGSNISIGFRDVVADAYPDVDIDFFLAGTVPYPGFPEEAGKSISIDLTSFSFYADEKFGDSCKSSGDLWPISVLVMELKE
jgi:hypothetical protein